MAEASFHSLFPLSHLLTPQPDKLEYPSDITISQQAKDLIGGLLVKPALRLGSGPTGVDELRHHPFFSVHSILVVMFASSFIPSWLTRTIDWDNLRHFPSPVVPDHLDLDSKPTNPMSASLFVLIRLFIIHHNTDSTGAFRGFPARASIQRQPASLCWLHVEQRQRKRFC
jgi:hypothetical protein